MAGDSAGTANPARLASDDRMLVARRNETRSLSLMSALLVNSGTGDKLAGNRGLLGLPRYL
jgi:hypothetical protein